MWKADYMAAPPVAAVLGSVVVQHELRLANVLLREVH